MNIRAAVVRRHHELTVETVHLAEPQADEVLIRIRAAGVCHSDLHTLRGELRAPPPLVLGHEGAGIVERVGNAVTSVAPGDRVMVNWLPADHTCPTCLAGHPSLCERFATTTFQARLPDGSSRLTAEGGTTLGHMLSAATMAEYVVVKEAGVIGFPEGVPFEVAAITGCAVMTGVGAVLNTAQTAPGSTAAVIGCGGVGLSALLGCRLAGCYPIIAVDVIDSKLDFARELGATHTVNSSKEDAVERLRELTNGGPQYVFDSVGAEVTVRQALEAAHSYGTATIVGMHSAIQNVSIPLGALVFPNKRLLGSFVGSSVPMVDLPRLVELYRAGRLELDKLITRSYQLDEIAQAFEDMEAGRVVRGVLVFD